MAISIVCALLLLTHPAAAAARVTPPDGSRRVLASFLGGLFGTERVQQDFDEAHLLAEQAAAAALSDGDTSSAIEQQRTVHELDDQAERVRNAAEDVRVYEDAAERADRQGEYKLASYEQEMAEDAAMYEEEEEAALQELIARAKAFAQLSLMERLNPLPLVSVLGQTSPNDAANAAGTSLGLTRAAVRGRLETSLADAPLLTAVLEATTLIAPLVGLLAAFHVLRRGGSAAHFNLRSEALLLCHLYWNCYYTTLAVMTVALPSEPPLVAFARAQPGEYAVYQVDTALAYVVYMGVLARHVYVERTPYAAAQLACALLVFTGSYAYITYPAITDRLPPACGWPTYFFFAAVFAGITVLIRTERKGKGE